MSARSHALQASAASGAARWTRGPNEPQLGRAAVHVWRADLSTLGDDVIASLNAEERERAARIVGERERRLWERSRGVLRALLGRYLLGDASTVELTVGRRGKPELAGAGRQRLLFNLSHSRQLALYAFTSAGPVGVDVQVERDEGPRAAADHVALARRAFGDAEARRLSDLAPAAREREFLRLWTRHEAELKRRGTGIGGATPGERTAAAEHAAPWIVELDVGAQAVAAVASERDVRELRLWKWA